MEQRVSPPLTLARLPVGSCAVVTQIAGGHALQRKLRGLGIRLGTELRVEHRRGSGLVVSVGNTRIALGGGIVEKLIVTRLDDSTLDTAVDAGSPSGLDAAPQSD
ncbi:MAG: ferrous iron transport protein A [Halochromatium sp.]